MRLVQVFEPPMCCSTGVCGPEVDPALVQFASDLESLRASGVRVERFSLSQSPNQFATTPAVLALLREHGAGALPAILADGRLVHEGSYPDAAKLKAIVNALPPDAAPLP
ncbi:MAG TPA: arsenite efflux transporter metallochaperone ArsD, partial [Thermoanaerobaculia bacterium]|nr:arsenite efflux transporter metallochaperone ArsD [Thermoanaerobaculia bacterium]